MLACARGAGARAAGGRGARTKPGRSRCRHPAGPHERPATSLRQGGRGLRVGVLGGGAARPRDGDRRVVSAGQPGAVRTRRPRVPGAADRGVGRRGLRPRNGVCGLGVVGQARNRRATPSAEGCPCDRLRLWRNPAGGPGPRAQVGEGRGPNSWPRSPLSKVLALRRTKGHVPSLRCRSRSGSPRPSGCWSPRGGPAGQAPLLCACQVVFHPDTGPASLPNTNFTGSLCDLPEITFPRSWGHL